MEQGLFYWWPIISEDLFMYWTGREIDLIVPCGEIKELSETLDFFFLQFNSQLMMIELTVGPQRP